MALSVGGLGFLTFRYLLRSLLRMRLHCFMVCLICFWYLLVGFFGVAWKLLLARNVSILLWYSLVYIITRVLPLSAFVMIALFSLILCWMFLVRYICLLCFVLLLLRLCCNCLSFLVASIPSRKTHSGTEPRRNKPSVPNGH